MRNFSQVMAVLAIPLLTALLQRHLVVVAISSRSDISRYQNLDLFAHF